MGFAWLVARRLCAVYITQRQPTLVRSDLVELVRARARAEGGIGRRGGWGEGAETTPARVKTYNVQFLTPIVHRHVPPLTRIALVGKQLIHKLPHAKAPLPKHALLTILAKNNVLLGQCTCAAHADGLLARRDHVEADAPLPLRVEHDNVHDGDKQHVCVQFCDLLVGLVRGEGRVDDGAVGVDGAVGGHGGEGRGLLKDEGRGEGRLDGAGELHVL